MSATSLVDIAIVVFPKGCNKVENNQHFTNYPHHSLCPRTMYRRKYHCSHSRVLYLFKIYDFLAPAPCLEHHLRLYLTLLIRHLKNQTENPRIFHLPDNQFSS